MGAFESYFDGSYVPPDNLRRFKPCDCDQIMYVGGTCTHVFEFPFYCEDDDFDSIEVTYHQQDRVSLTKQIDGVGDGDGTRFVKVTLTPDETSKFDDRLLDCLVQLKVTKGGTILFSRLFRIKLKRSLEVTEDE